MVAETAEELRNNPGDRVPENPVDPGFATRFFEYAQDATEDSVRTLWAGLLADEVRHGEGVVRALEVLRSLSKAEAQLFALIAPRATADGFIPMSPSQAGEFPEGFEFVHLLALADAGLLNPNFTLEYRLGLESNIVEGRYKEVLFTVGRYVLNVESATKFSQSVQGVALTAAGRVVWRSMGVLPDLAFFGRTCEQLTKMSQHVKAGLYPIVGTGAGGLVLVANKPYFESVGQSWKPPGGE